MTTRKINGFGVFFSLVCIYFLAQHLDRSQGWQVSLSFALLNIYAARSFDTLTMRIRSVVYLLIAMATYFILYNDQPWEFFLRGGVWDDSALPLIVCSMIMTVNGWLLLRGWRARTFYIFITLGIQIPVGMLIGWDSVQSIFSGASHFFHYQENYSGSLQFWQYEWMLTYHLPFYFLASISQDR